MWNILFVIGTYPSYGGTEKVTTVLANEFVKRGHSVCIASFEQPNPELKNEELNDLIQLIELDIPVRKKTNLITLKKIILERNIDFIVNQWCLPFYVTTFLNKARKGTRAKLISVYHNQPNRNAKSTDVKIKLELYKKSSLLKYLLYSIKFLLVDSVIRLSTCYVYLKSDQYVVLSNSFKQIFMDYAFLKNPKKLSVITNPLTIKVEDFSIDSKENVIIYVGRIDFNQKRVERIVHIWNEIYQEIPDWRLEIIGDGPEKDNLEKYVMHHNIKRITFEGFKDPLSYYKRASMLLLTSEYEGFGLVISEGMSYGVVPIVYGSYSAVFDLIDNNTNGFITNKPYNNKEFNDIIMNLSKNTTKRKQIANNCITKSKEFSLNETSKKWLELFNKIK